MRKGIIDRPCRALLAAWMVVGWTGPAASQTVQKCIAADGHVTLTSGACADGHRLAGTYDAVPEASEPVVAAQARLRASPRASGYPAPAQVAPRVRSRVSRSPAGNNTAAKRCKSAREHREQTLRRVGLKRTFDLLRRLDDDVWAACRP